MASQLLAAASPSTTTTAAAATTSTSPASTATTISYLGYDDLREIFLRLPDLPALVRAAFTCRPWLHAIRSSRPFRRLFRDLHPSPLIGLFLAIGTHSAPSFLPLRRHDPVVAAALRRGDFFLTSLPPLPTGWGLADCRAGYVLLWNNKVQSPSVAALNPMTWAVDVLPPLPGHIATGSRRRDFGVLGFHLLSSDESPWSFRVTCVCTDHRNKIRAAVFSSETWEWTVRPWVHVGGNSSLKYMAGTLAGGSIFWPYQGEELMVRIDTATMDVSFMDLPPRVEPVAYNFGIGETRFEIDEITIAPVLGVELDLKILQVSSGLVHLSSTGTTQAGTLHCWFFSFSLETMVLELLLEGSFDGVAHLYNMAWPPSLVGDDDESIGTT